MEEGENLYLRAQEEEVRFDFAAALADYDVSLARSPSGRYALAARARSEDLRAHSEGAFAPLTTLEHARRSPQTIESIDTLEIAANGFPDGRVRGEARMLGAEAYLDRLGQREKGLKMLDLVMGDASCDETLRRFAARRIADAALAEGRTSDAIAAARAARDRDLERRVVRAARRVMLRRTSIAVLAITIALAAVAMRSRASRVRARASLRAALPAIAIFATIAGVGGGVLASLYERGNAWPFLIFGVAIALVGMIAGAWSAAGSTSNAARAMRSAACAAAIVAAGFLVLDRMGATYLEGFGL